MSSATGFASARPARPMLRPLALPTEHGGWGFLFEPIVLGLAVAPSLAGLLIAIGFLFGFLARQPLKLALQDALRGKTYPRTIWCRRFAAGYAAAGACALALAVAVAGWPMLIPVAAVAPLGLVQLAYDAKNRSRVLLPELGGTVAMASSAAAIALAAGKPLALALSLSAIVIARGLPAIVYVRTLLQRAHGQRVSSRAAIAMHLLAAGAVALFAPALAVAAMVLLLARAVWRLTRPVVPPAKTIGWTEIAFGLLTIALAATGVLTGI